MLFDLQGLREFVRWFYTGGTLPERYRDHELELEEARDSTLVLVRSMQWALIALVAAVVVGYVLGVLKGR